MHGAPGGPLMLSGLAGPLRRVVRRLGRARLLSHRLVGRLVELGGNQVTIEGLHFSVDNPLITRRQKGLLDVGLHERERSRWRADTSTPTFPSSSLEAGSASSPASSTAG